MALEVQFFSSGAKQQTLWPNPVRCRRSRGDEAKQQLSMDASSPKSVNWLSTEKAREETEKNKRKVYTLKV